MRIYCFFGFSCGYLLLLARYCCLEQLLTINKISTKNVSDFDRETFITQLYQNNNYTMNFLL